MVPRMQIEAICRNESRTETVAAFAASILLHVLLILAIGFFLYGMARIAVPIAPETPDEPIQITIVPPAPLPKPRPAYVETPETTSPERKPKKDSSIESNNDSIAASEAPPDGTEPLPSISGRDDQGIAFRDQIHTQGTSTPSQTNPAPAATPEARAEPIPTPKADLALLEAPALPPTLTNSPSRPKQTAASQSAYQPETRVTRLKGNVSNRGRASIEAEATPLGRYKKQVSDAIGSCWYFFVRDQIDLLNVGRVEIRFTVAPEGKIKNPTVLSNSSNESFASVSLAAIMAAEIPPIPPDVAKILENGRLEIDYSFSILGHQ